MINTINPKQAWEQLQNNSGTVLIDVRTAGEYAFVGHSPLSVFIPWKEAPDWTSNPNFLTELEAATSSKDTPLILMCRSGQRSMQAAQFLELEGYSNLSNMEEGFEGDLDDQKHRGNINGWRFHQLPWQQS